MQLMANGFWYVNILRSMLSHSAVVELIETYENKIRAIPAISQSLLD
jgi:hypothetical protein